MNQKHRTYREIKQKFPPERQQKISAGAEKIETRLKILSAVRQAAGLTQEELVALLDVGESHNSPQVENRDDITFSTLVGVITAMGGSIDLIIKFPEKPSVQLSQIESLFLEQTGIDRLQVESDRP